MVLRDATQDEIEKHHFCMRYSPSFKEGESNQFAIVFQVELEFESRLLEIDYLSIFETSSEFSEDFKNSQFVKINAPAIAFPFIRSYIAHITLIAGYKPVVLPSFNFVERSKAAADGASAE